MNTNRLFTEQVQIVPAFAPVDMAASSGPVSDWVSLKNYHRVAVVLIAAIGTAANDTILTLEQATSVSGTGVKALNFSTVYVKQGLDLTTIGQFTAVANPNADNSYTSDTSGEEQLVWVVNINADDLDIDGGFDCIRASVNDHGAAKIGSLTYYLHDPKYARDIQLSAIAN